MSFGGLLGSLYGDLLPAPKSLNEPVTVTEGSECTDSRTRSQSSSDVVKEEPGSAPKSSTEDDKSFGWTNDRSRLLLLQPINRKRDTNRRSSNITAPLAKRVKESLEAPASAVSEILSDQDRSIDQTSSRQLLPVPNEYDPTKPNSYDDYIKERARSARKREEDARRQEELERIREEQRKAFSATAQISSNLNVSGEEAWRRRGQITQVFFGNGANSSPPAPEGEKRGFAQKMLEKMGWKHGEGLGRERQGILAPLVARKTDKRSGVIIQGAEQPKNAPKTSSMNVAQPTINSSRVVLLTNLVGKGEVDTDLESETAEEAAKYGNLLSVKIIEQVALPDDQAVRIFCEYDSKDAAAKALHSFNGRLFGGRTVRAEFFPEVTDRVY